MSIRLRLILTLVLTGLIPVIVLVYLMNHTVNSLHTSVLNVHQGIIAQAPLEITEPLVNLNGQMAAEINAVTIQLYIVGSVVVVGAVVLGVLLSSTITVPIMKMAKAAERATRGYLEAFQPSDDPSELGALSRSIYAMTIQLTEGMENLEQQATERTRELSRRSEQLEVAAQIGREVSTILSVNRLSDEVTRLISERFGYYHVAIFMVDDMEEYAVLRAANSSGGKNLLDLGHKLVVGETSIVGYVAKYGKARVAFDVASDQFFFRNPELPETRSEAALPLRIGDKVIGVLDIQSIALSAFSLDDMRVLQIVADQVALAIENTRLFTEHRQAMQELEQAYGRQVVSSWMRRLRNAPLTYIFNRLGVEPADSLAGKGVADSLIYTSSKLDSEQNQLTVPVIIRGEVIGSVMLRRESGAVGWTEDDLLLVQDVLEQIAPALESARLLEETRAHAMREQAVNVVSTQVRQSAGMDAILQNAVRELGKVLGSSRTFIQLGVQTTNSEAGYETEGLGVADGQ